MSFEELLQRRKIERVEPSLNEIHELLAVARRDVRTAQAVRGTDLDWTFAIAYNAILQVSIAFMRHLGYRPRGEAKHFNTFGFMELALPDQQHLIRRIQKFRKKRNATMYQAMGSISEQEALDALTFAQHYVEVLAERLSEWGAKPTDE